MSTTKRLMQASPDQVWAVLADGWLYPVWVVGATRMREVDDHWPALSARLHHSVGELAVLIDDITEVLEPHRLRGWCCRRAPGRPVAPRHPHAAARRAPRPRWSSRRTPASGPGALVPKPLADLGLTWRNVESLRRLAFLAERRAERAGRDVRRRRRRRRPQRAGRGQPARRRGLVGARARGQPDPAARCAATARCTPASCTTPSARSTRWPRRLRTIRSLRARGARPAVAARPGGARQPDAPTAAWALLHRDRDVTAAAGGRPHAGDGDAWLELCAEWDDVGDALIGALLTPFPPVRPGLPACARLPAAGGSASCGPCSAGGRPRAAAASAARAPRCSWRATPATPTSRSTRPGSGLMALLMTMLGQTVGFPAPEGGAGAAHRGAGRPASTALGGEIRCRRRGRPGSTSTAAGRAGVRTADGGTVRRPAGGDRRRRRAARCTAGCSTPGDVPAATPPRHAPLPAGPGHGQGRLGARRRRCPGPRPPADAPGTVHVADSRRRA